MSPDDADKTLGEIVSDVSEKASLLVREEIELAKAEVTSKVSTLGKGAGIAAAAGVFLVFAITMLFHGLAWLLDDLFDWNSIWPGFLIMFVVLTMLATIAGYSPSACSRAALRPRRTSPSRRPSRPAPTSRHRRSNATSSSARSRKAKR